MMNNPMQLILTAARNGGDPRQIVAQMARSNPQYAQAAQMINGKSPQQLQQMALNMCRERGIRPEEIIQSLMSQGV